MGHMRILYYDIPKAIFYLLKGDYRVVGLGFGVWGLGNFSLGLCWFRFQGVGLRV